MPCSCPRFAHLLSQIISTVTLHVSLCGDEIMPKREYDPLSVIPSKEAIRQKLEALQEQARRLGILLRTAEEIERDGQDAKAGQQRQGVADA